MIELGKYAFPVLMSYGAAIAMVLGLVMLSIRDQRKTRAFIRALEKDTK